MRNLLILIVILALLGGGYYWYTSQEDAAMESDTMMQNDAAMMNDSMDDSMQGSADGSMQGGSGTSVNVNVDASVSAGAVQTFTIEGKNFSYSPESISVKKGDTVRIVFKNVGGTHDLRVEGYNVGTKVVQAGQEETIEFVANKAGDFEYYCSVGNHRAMGMVGTLTVTE